MSPSLRWGMEAKKTPACVLGEMETSPRWGDLSRAALSLLYGPLHHHIEAVNPSSNWPAAADMWFLSSDFTTGLDSAEVTPIAARNMLIVDLGSVRIENGYASGVAKHMKRPCPWCSWDVMWVHSDIWKAWFCMWVGSVWFNADQLLESIWCYFFWPVHPVGPVGFVPGQISAALCSLLLRIIWAVSAKCMWADGFVFVFFLNYYFSREVFFFWQRPALANITGFYTWV